MQSHVHCRRSDVGPSNQENAATPSVQREIAHPEARPELEGAQEDHYDCERDVNPDENANRPERLETLRCVLKQVVQRVATNVVDERTQKQSPQ